MLCEASQHARRPNHPLNPYFIKLCATKGYKPAIVAVAHRLCRIIYSMLKHKTELNIGHLNVEYGPFTKKTKRLFKLKN